MKFNVEALKSINWNSFQKLTTPQAADELNIFLEKLPKNTNKSILVITAIIWGSAAVLGLYTTVKMQELAELSIKRGEAQALLPIVPKIQDKPVDTQEVKTFVDELHKTYKDLEIKGSSSNIVINAKSTANYGQFREAIGHIQNGGFGWRVNVEKMCVGKECKQFPLSATLRINKVSVEK